MEYLQQVEYDATILIFDGLVVTPRFSYSDAITHMEETLAQSRQFVREKYDWDMPIKMDSFLSSARVRAIRAWYLWKGLMCGVQRGVL